MKTVNRQQQRLSLLRTTGREDIGELMPSIFSTICSPLSAAIGPVSINRPSRSTVSWSQIAFSSWMR